MPSTAETRRNNGLSLRPYRAHGLGDLERKARAPGEIAAVGIVALVGERGEELVDQVAVRVVDFEDVEAGFQRALGGVRPCS